MYLTESSPIGPRNPHDAPHASGVIISFWRRKCLWVLGAACLVAASCGRRQKKVPAKDHPDGVVWVQLRGPRFSFKNQDAEAWNVREAVIRYRIGEIRKVANSSVSALHVSMYELVVSDKPFGASWKPPPKNPPPPPPPPEPPPAKQVEPPAEFWFRFAGEKPVVKSSRSPKDPGQHESDSPGKTMEILIGDILWLTETRAEVVSDYGRYYLSKINGRWQVTGYEVELLE
ncbi:hypothetical protein [Prosthecobacter sp.]|uniref:hypothetical protein n=1 Tax=Prosthecobacter sp. TaxID=1965333 RepID=UPI0037844A75